MLEPTRVNGQRLPMYIQEREYNKIRNKRIDSGIEIPLLIRMYFIPLSILK